MFVVVDTFNNVVEPGIFETFAEAEEGRQHVFEESGGTENGAQLDQWKVMKLVPVSW